MSDVLANPRFLVGIPLGDCNLATPSPDGLPSGWFMGALTSGRIGALHAWHAESVGANPLGAGRSLHVSVESAFDGSSNSAIMTPPSPFGMVPNVGVAASLWPRVVLVYRANLQASGTVSVSVRGYSDAGAETFTLTVGTIAAAQNTSGEWRSIVLAHTSASTVAATTRYFRVRLTFNATAGTGTFGLDFVGLGFIPDGSIGELTEAHVIDGLTSTWEHRGHLLQPEYGTVTYRRNVARGIRLARVGFGLERCASTTRNLLEWLRHSEAGTPTGGGDLVHSGGLAGHLGGWSWPVLLVPNHPGMKQAMYARISELSFDVDRRLGYVESAPAYSGQIVFDEVSF